MSDIAERAQQVLDVPLQHALGATLLDPADPAAGLGFPITGLACTPLGTMHGGALSSIMEAAAVLAILPALSAAEHAVTHAYAVQFLGAANEGTTVEVRGTLLRRGRNLAFVSVTADVQGQIIGQAQITKSIVARPA